MQRNYSSWTQDKFLTSFSEFLWAYKQTWHYARRGEKIRLEDWQLMSLFKNTIDSKITKTHLSKIKGQRDLGYLNLIF